MEPGNRTPIVLPEDIISLILLRLPAASIIKFRSVCKSWHSLTSNASFVRDYDARHTKLSSCSVILRSNVHDPGHVFVHRFSPSIVDVVDSFRIDISSDMPCDPTVFEFLSLEGSCDGLLCFQRYPVPAGNEYYICNLPSKEGMAVPKGGKGSRFCALYYRPSTREYVLLAYFHRAACPFKVFSLKRSNRTWRRIKGSSHQHNPSSCLGRRLKDGGQSSIPPVTAHGGIHWDPYGHGGWILMFNVESEQFERMDIPTAAQPDDDTYKPNCIVSMRESLGLFRITERQMELWFLKDYAGREWIKLPTIRTDCISRSLGPGRPAQGLWPLAVCKDGDEILFSDQRNDTSSGRLNQVFFAYSLQLREIVQEVKFAYSHDRALWTETLLCLSYSF